MNPSIFPLALGALVLIGCSEVAPTAPRTSAGSAGGGGAAGATTGAGGGATPLAACDALTSTMASSNSRWSLDVAKEQAGYPLSAQLLETGLDGASSTLLLTLVVRQDQSTRLLASRFDGRKAPSGPEATELSATVIPVPDQGAHGFLAATRAAVGKVRVLLGGADDHTPQWFELDVTSNAISAIHELGAPVRPMFLAASATEMIAGMQAISSPWNLAVGSEKHASFATAPLLGCLGGPPFASGLAVGDGFLVSTVVPPCGDPSGGGLYLWQMHDGEAPGPPKHIPLDFTPTETSLVRSGDTVSLSLLDSVGPYSGAYSIKLALDGSPLGAPRSLGGTLGLLRPARLGAHAVTGLNDGIGHAITLVTDEGKTLAKRVFGSLALPGYPLDLQASGDDTLVVAWTDQGSVAPDTLVHVDQLRCGAAGE